MLHVVDMGSLHSTRPQPWVAVGRRGVAAVDEARTPTPAPEDFPDLHADGKKQACQLGVVLWSY